MRAAVILLFFVVFIAVSCGESKSEDQKNAELMMEDFAEALSNREFSSAVDLMDLVNSRVCRDVFADVVGGLPLDSKMSLAEVRELSPKVFEIQASGPWGEEKKFTVRLGADPSIKMPDSLSTLCITKAAERVIGDFYDAVASGDAEAVMQMMNLPFTDCSANTMQRVLADLPAQPLNLENISVGEDGTVEVVASGPWGDSQPFSLDPSREKPMLPIDNVLVQKCYDLLIAEVEAEILEACLESLDGGYFDDLSADVRDTCVEFPELQSIYGGPYTFAGDNQTVTEDFCITERKLNVAYNSKGIGRFPDIYHVSFTLYTASGSFADGVVGLTGSGNFNFQSYGTGCYYLEADPFEAHWEVTISQ